MKTSRPQNIHTKYILFLNSEQKTSLMLKIFCIKKVRIILL